MLHEVQTWFSCHENSFLFKKTFVSVLEEYTEGYQWYTNEKSKDERHLSQLRDY